MPEEFENAALFLRSFFENALQTGGIWKRRLFVSVWTKDISKMELFENDVACVASSIVKARAKFNKSNVV